MRLAYLEIGAILLFCMASVTTGLTFISIFFHGDRTMSIPIIAAFLTGISFRPAWRALERDERPYMSRLRRRWRLGKR